MSGKEMQELVDGLRYWDSRVTHLNCNYFADEIELIYEDEASHVILNFIGCYQSLFHHIRTCDKLRPVKEMNIAQIPYFL